MHVALQLTSRYHSDGSRFLRLGDSQSDAEPRGWLVLGVCSNVLSSLELCVLALIIYGYTSTDHFSCFILASLAWQNVSVWQRARTPQIVWEDERQKQVRKITSQYWCHSSYLWTCIMICITRAKRINLCTYSSFIWVQFSSVYKSAILEITPSATSWSLASTHKLLSRDSALYLSCSWYWLEGDSCYDINQQVHPYKAKSCDKSVDSVFSLFLWLWSQFLFVAQWAGTLWP